MLSIPFHYNETLWMGTESEISLSIEGMHSLLCHVVSWVEKGQMVSLLSFIILISAQFLISYKK